MFNGKYGVAIVGVYEHIYIYIERDIEISLNIFDISCLHILMLILSYCRIDFIVFGGN